MPIIKLLFLSSNLPFFALFCDMELDPVNNSLLPASRMSALSVEGNQVILQGYKDKNTLFF